jgi:hypothetical protein
VSGKLGTGLDTKRGKEWGLSYVEVSRATSTEGLQMVSFSPEKVKEDENFIVNLMYL